MSYYVSLENCDRIRVRHTRFDDLLEHVREKTANHKDLSPFTGTTIQDFIDYIQDHSFWQFELSWCDDLVLTYDINDGRLGDDALYLSLIAGFLYQDGWEDHQCAYVTLTGGDGGMWYWCMRDGTFREITVPEPVWE